MDVPTPPRKTLAEHQEDVERTVESLKTLASEKMAPATADRILTAAQAVMGSLLADLKRLEERLRLLERR